MALPTPSQAFGRAAREVRLARRMSQEKTALESGLDRAYYGHIERATKSPTLTTVWKVAKALEVAPSDLLRRAEELIEHPGSKPIVAQPPEPPPDKPSKRGKRGASGSRSTAGARGASGGRGGRDASGASD